MLASQCLVRDCNNRRVERTLACQQHLPEWHRYAKSSKWHNQTGVCQMLQWPRENYPWQPNRRGPNPQQYDDPNEDPPLPSNYFCAARFYCVETICAPCGVVIAWTKFARSESPTNILNFLGKVYPTEESRPNYICIDKGCQVLATAVTNRSWDIWKKNYSNYCGCLSLYQSSGGRLPLL